MTTSMLQILITTTDTDIASSVQNTTGISTDVVTNEHSDSDHASLHDHDSYEEDTVYEIIVSVFSLLVSVFIGVGNSATLIAISRNHRLRTIPNMYIASLAIADLMVGVMLLAQSISTLSLGEDYADHQEYFCLILMSLLFVSVAASMFSSLLVACDRYIYIMYPLKYSRLVTQDKSLVAIMIMWILAFIYGTVPIYTSHFNEMEGCSPTHMFSPIYMIVVHPIVFFIDCGISFFLYFRIARTAIRQQRRIQDQDNSIIPANGVKRISRRYWRVVKLLMLVLGFFFLSWCPLLIIGILEYTIHVRHFVLSLGSLLAVANSGINFVVLSAMYADYRSEYHRLFCCLSRKTKVRPFVTSLGTSNNDSSLE